MVVHHADWVLPIATPPIRNGWVAVEQGRIVAAGADGDPLPPGQSRSARRAAAARVILPGLVNAHTHLELSYMRGLVPPAVSFDGWVRTLISLRGRYPDPFASDIIHAAIQAIEEARGTGTAVLGDVSNTLVSARMVRDAGMAAHVFHEVLGFNAADPDGLVRAARKRIEALDISANVRASVTPHAPYSVSPALFRSIAAEGSRVSIHLGESPEEIEFLNAGDGPLRAALEWLHAWNESWTPPRCGPVEYIDKFGLLSERLLAVHGVHLSYRELAQLTAAGATLVTCPRSNRWVGAGDPDVTQFYASGVRVAVGTDSLASVDDLNLFSELARIRALGPAIPARSILESATRIGAEALGFGADYGTIEQGKRAALIAVRVPETVADVEEYLVRGVDPSDVQWIKTTGEPRTFEPGEPLTP